MRGERCGILKSWVEISKARLQENFRAIQSVAGPAVEVLAVVKANGYGHDASICGPLLVGAKARWLGVSDVDEGARLRERLGEGSTRVLVMCGMELGDAAMSLDAGGVGYYPTAQFVHVDVGPVRHWTYGAIAKKKKKRGGHTRRRA